MAFNLGAFASGFAKAGVDTYATMEAIKSQKKRDELVDMQLQKEKAAFAEEQAIREAGKDIYGKVGTDDYAPELQRTTAIGQQQTQALAPSLNSGKGGEDFDRAVAESTQGVLREHAERKGAAVPADAAMAPKKYTEAQANADYAAKLKTINVEKGMQAEKGALELKGLKRSADIDSRFDKLAEDANKLSMDRVTTLKGVTAAAEATGSLKPFVDTYGPELKKMGMSTKMVGNSIVVMQKGQPQHVVNSPADAAALLNNAFADERFNYIKNGMLSAGVFKDAASFSTYVSQRHKEGIDERTVSVAESRLAAQNARDYAYTTALGQKTGNWQPVGTDKDNTPISYDRNTGKYERADGKPIQDISIFKKVSGEKAARDPKVVDELSKGYALEIQGATTPDAIKAVNKKYAGLGLDTGYVDAVDAKANKLKGDPFAKEGKGSKPAAVVGQGTSGSHRPVDAALPTRETESEAQKRARILDINRRLSLQGISDETRADLELQRSMLLGSGLPRAGLIRFGDTD